LLCRSAPLLSGMSHSPHTVAAAAAAAPSPCPSASAAVSSDSVWVHSGVPRVMKLDNLWLELRSIPQRFNDPREFPSQLQSRMEEIMREIFEVELQGLRHTACPSQSACVHLHFLLTLLGGCDCLSV
jgi:hypothetical protein